MPNNSFTLCWVGFVFCSCEAAKYGTRVTSVSYTHLPSPKASPVSGNPQPALPILPAALVAAAEAAEASEAAVVEVEAAAEASVNLFLPLELTVHPVASALRLNKKNSMEMVFHRVFLFQFLF